MTTSTIVKFATLTGTFTNGFSGRNNCTSGVATIDGELFGFLPNESKPYQPIGGRKVLKSLIDVLVFKPYNYGNEVSVKIGRKL